MKFISNLALVCAIFITNLVHIAVSEPSYNPRDFEKYLQRLEKETEDSPNILPFTITNNLIENLKETSTKFKKLCVDYDSETLKTEGNYSPVSSLDKAIKKVFFNYTKSGSENWNKVGMIQFVNPVGFIAYLTKKHEDENSPNFMKSAEEFRKVMMPPFDRFLQGLGEIINGHSLCDDDLPFSLQINVIEDLKKTSNEFKELCVKFNGEHQMRTGKYAPVSALTKTINQIFKEYNDSAIGNHILFKNIQEVDPIGLNVYLTKEKLTSKSLTFVKAAKTFQTTMNHRLRLLKSRTSNEHIEFFRGNSVKKVHEIPSNIRERVTTEFERFHKDTIDFFTGIVMEQRPEIKMYRLNDYKNVNKYKPHRSSEIDDVQILYSPSMGPYHEPHAVCIHYQASSKNVLVYDSAMYKSLDSNRLEIIDKLYPFKKDIIFVEPKTIRGKHQAGGPFVIVYATMLLLKADPKDTAIRLNNVHGDEALFMRFHILNMFANRRLTMMK